MNLAFVNLHSQSTFAVLQARLLIRVGKQAFHLLFPRFNLAPYP